MTIGEKTVAVAVRKRGRRVGSRSGSNVSNSLLVRILRTVRIEQGMSQHALDQKLGYKSSMINQWETGRFSPNLTRFEKWAEALGLEIELMEKTT